MLVTGIRGWGQTSRIFLAIKAIRGSETRWVSQTPRRSASRGSTWSRGLREKNSHKAKLGFLVKCIYRIYICIYTYIYICIYLFGRWCLGDVLLLHFLTGPHFWVPSCWSRFWGIYHDQIQYPSQNHWWDVHFGHKGPLTLGLKNPQNPCNSVLPDVFAVWERQENKATSWIANCVKITWSWLLHTSHKKLTPNTNLASSVECGFLKSPLKEYSYLLYHILKP